MKDVVFSDPSRVSNPTRCRVEDRELKAFCFTFENLNPENIQIFSCYSIHPVKGNFPGISVVQKTPYREILRISFEGYPEWELFNWMLDSLDGQEAALSVVLCKNRRK